MLSFLPLKNNSVTRGFYFVLDSASPYRQTLLTVFKLNYSLQNISKHYQLLVNNQ